jgi:drug/metabolite transporter (DMT)-like permease
MSTTVAAAFLDEPVNAVQLAGMAVVIGAVGLVVLRTEREVDAQDEPLLEAEPPF